MTTTFVSCIVKLYETEPFEYKNMEWRIEYFKKIAQKGFKIVLYVDKSSFLFFNDFVSEFPNVCFLFLDFKDTQIYKECKRENLELPNHRNEKKDTVEYLALMNSKIEYINDAISKNVWNTEYFAWFDFSMAYLFNDLEPTLTKMKKLHNIQSGKSFCLIPGCWNQLNNTHFILNSIHWRFCGTFFIGDKKSLLDFYNAYIIHFPEFLKTHNKLVWEVNFWAWLEKEKLFTPTWYISNHNDSIISELEINEYIF